MSQIPSLHGFLQVSPGESLVQCNEVTHYRHQKSRRKVNGKWETTSKIKAVHFTPEYIL